MKRHAVRVGLVGVALFVLCLVWRVFMTGPAEETFHLTALRVALPGFGGYDLTSILWGGTLAFVYGFLAALLFHALHKDCCVPKK